ncbi:beta-defensin 19 precursor [Rattus norvegicus]|uniref:Beta-defensin n=2 Tax=Rattus norvegicus TaxID=10116 RepID=F1M796_RAT|nr:beta-defensin 19 precursor [Rattus norvegicus]
MKYLLLNLLVFFILFQLFPVYRCRKSCWVIRGHCRKHCRSGERVKKPCSNGDYCCIAKKINTVPQAPKNAFSRNFRVHSRTAPVAVLKNST